MYSQQQADFVAENNLDYGSEVLVTRIPTQEEKKFWGNSWVDGMERAVGRMCKVVGISGFGIQLSAKTTGAYTNFYYPFFCLEVINSSKKKGRLKINDVDMGAFTTGKKLNEFIVEQVFKIDEIKTMVLDFGETKLDLLNFHNSCFGITNKDFIEGLVKL